MSPKSQVQGPKFSPLTEVDCLWTLDLGLKTFFYGALTR